MLRTRRSRSSHIGSREDPMASRISLGCSFDDSRISNPRARRSVGETSPPWRVAPGRISAPARYVDVHVRLYPNCWFSSGAWARCSLTGSRAPLSCETTFDPIGLGGTFEKPDRAKRVGSCSSIIRCGACGRRYTVKCDWYARYACLLAASDISGPT